MSYDSRPTKTTNNTAKKCLTRHPISPLKVPQRKGTSPHLLLQMGKPDPSGEHEYLINTHNSWKQKSPVTFISTVSLFALLSECSASPKLDFGIAGGVRVENVDCHVKTEFFGNGVCRILSRSKCMRNICRVNISRLILRLREEP